MTIHPFKSRRQLSAEKAAEDLEAFKLRIAQEKRPATPRPAPALCLAAPVPVAPRQRPRRPLAAPLWQVGLAYSPTHRQWAVCVGHPLRPVLFLGTRSASDWQLVAEGENVHKALVRLGLIAPLCAALQRMRRQATP